MIWKVILKPIDEVFFLMSQQEPTSGSRDDGPDKSETSRVTDRTFDELSTGNDPGIVTEFVQFLRYDKKWWLIPILLVTLLLIGAAILLPSPVAPFIYTLF